MSMQILRGGETYNPSNNDKQYILKDGQLFYSKFNKKLYIGEDDKPITDLKGTNIGLNIENGESVGSLKQVTYDNDDKNPKANGLGAIAFGGFRADKTSEPVSLPGFDLDTIIVNDIINYGRYSTEGAFKNLISDTTAAIYDLQSYVFGAGGRAYGKWNFNVGKDNLTFGKSSYVFGNGNVNGDPNKNSEYSFSLTTGSSNINTGTHSFVSGENNVNTGNWSIVAGKGIENEGKFSAIFGGGAVSSALPFIIHNVGEGNLLAGYSLNSHSSQFEIDCNYVSLLGRTLTATNNCQTIVGRNSSYAVNGTSNLRFAVATGWYKHKTTGQKISTSAFDKLSDTDKVNYEVVSHNGFEIYEGGLVKVYKTPETDSEVARLKEIKELDTKITTGLEVERSVREAADTGLDNRINTKKNKSDFIYEDGVLTILI